MADSALTDVSKMKVVDLRKELKSRGLPHSGDKADLVSRLQNAIAQEEHGDITLDSDEIDSDGVLEDDDDKCQSDIVLDETADELALGDQPTTLDESVKPQKTLKRKLNKTNGSGTAVKSPENKEVVPKKIVLNRTASVPPLIQDKQTSSESNPASVEESKIKLSDNGDAKKRLEARAIRFGIPVKMSDEERKEARKKRFNQVSTVSSSTNNSNSTSASGTLTSDIEKLKQRAERFGQSVSKVMTEIELKEKLEKRKAKFNTVSS